MIIWGVTKMLTVERTHRDLIAELHSKNFGNRWISAYELAKLFSNSKIPETEKEWVIAELTQILKTSDDVRTQNFIILSLGSLKDTRTLPALMQGMESPDPQVKLNAVVALGNLPLGVDFDFEKLINLAKEAKETADDPLFIAVLLGLAQHKALVGVNLLEEELDSSSLGVRYAAATGLIAYKNAKSLPVLQEIFESKMESQDFIFQTQKNILQTIQREEWQDALPLVKKFVMHTVNPELKIMAQQTLILLKK